MVCPGEYTYCYWWVNYFKMWSGRSSSVYGTVLLWHHRSVRFVCSHAIVLPVMAKRKHGTPTHICWTAWGSTVQIFAVCFTKVWEVPPPWCDPLVGNKNTNPKGLSQQGYYWRKILFPGCRDKPACNTHRWGLWFSYWWPKDFSSLRVKIPHGAVRGCGINIPFRSLCHLDALLWLGIKIQILAVCFTKATIGRNHLSQDWEINLVYSQVGVVVFLLVCRRLLQPEDEGTSWCSPGMWNKHPL